MWCNLRVDVVALVADLMDRTRIGAVASDVGAEVRFVSRPGELEVDGADLVLIDLHLDGSIGAVSGLPRGTVVVGFGPHVDTARLKAASAAGCTRVLARSAFFSQLPEILGSGAGSTTDGGSSH